MAGCGGLITGMEGNFHSPNYPKNYPPEKTCIWTIEAPKGYYIQMKLIRFQLEEHIFCKYDSVEVRDGWDRKSPLLGLYCGNNPKQGNLLAAVPYNGGSRKISKIIVKKSVFS